MSGHHLASPPGRRVPRPPNSQLAASSPHPPPRGRGRRRLHWGRRASRCRRRSGCPVSPRPTASARFGAVSEFRGVIRRAMRQRRLPGRGGNGRAGSGEEAARLSPDGAGARRSAAGRAARRIPPQPRPRSRDPPLPQPPLCYRSAPACPRSARPRIPSPLPCSAQRSWQPYPPVCSGRSLPPLPPSSPQLRDKTVPQLVGCPESTRGAAGSPACLPVQTCCMHPKLTGGWVPFLTIGPAKGTS